MTLLIRNISAMCPYISLRNHLRHICSTSVSSKFNLKWSAHEYSIVALTREQYARLDLRQESSFLSITKTPREISLIAETHFFKGIENIESDWKMFYIDGPIPFNATGVLDALVNPLAKAKISLLAVSSFNSDYVLVKKNNYTLVTKILQDNGFNVSAE